MGVTLHYRFGQVKKLVPKMLDEVGAYATMLKEQQAEKVGIPFNITRPHPYRLHIDIGNCETLTLGFGGMEHWRKEAQGTWGYENEVLSKAFRPEALGSAEMMFAASFCKTQFAEALVEHKWVADILRMVAGRCYYSDVFDEGDYYHSNDLQDAATAIHGNGMMIDKLTTDLAKAMGANEKDIIKIKKHPATKIKPFKRRKPKNEK